MQTLDHNVPQNQDQDEQAQPLIVSQVSKDGDVEQAGRAKTEDDGPSQAITLTASTPESDPSTPTIASTSDQPKSSSSSTAASEPASASNIAPATNLSSSTHHPPPAVKRFSSATISKQFLHKATSGAGSRSDSTSQHSKPAPSNSALSGNSRPAQPTPTAHPSRLVTAKLTTNGPSSASSPGWNTPRPNSAINTANPSPAQTPGVLVPSSKQSAPAVANPNPSSEQSNSATRSGKPWGDVKKGAAGGPVVNVASDFPTAAEVARKSQASKPQKQIPPQLATDAASKALLNDSEDAFRGVHLDPKAHHWDDDEGDDDNYLGEVVEFADGTQYSVPPTATAENHPSPGLLGAALPTSLKLPPEAGENDAPIRKEDRFTDDFDRSWPKGRGSSQVADSPSTHPRELPSPAHTHSTLHSEHGDRGSRVLFNERSNRMEPAHPSWGRRDSEGPTGRRPPFPNRERPPFGGRDRWTSGGDHPSQAPNGRPPRGDRNSSYGNRRADMPPPPPPEETAWGRSSYRRQSNASQGDPPRMTSGMGSRNRQSHQDSERDFHQSRLPSGAPSRLEPSSPRTHRLPDQRSFDRPPPFGSYGRRESVASSVHKSPLLQSRSVTGEPVSPTMENGSEVAAAPGGALDPATKGEKLAALTKSEMHNAAQRARERRLKEEEERQKQQERARAKAAALAAAQEEEAAKAAEAERSRQEEERRRQEELKAKEEADRLDKERTAAVESVRPSDGPSDPLSAKPLSGTRPKLQLLPRTIPPPPLPPPEVSPAKRKETKPGDVTPFPGSAVTQVVRSLEEKHDDDIQVVDYKDLGLVMKGPSPQRRSESAGGKTTLDSTKAFNKEALKEENSELRGAHPNAIGPSWSPTEGPSPFDNVPSTNVLPSSPGRRPPPVVPPSPGFSTRHPALLSPGSARYREAPLSSVDETMLRLKGVLKSMADEHRQDDFAVSILSSEPVPSSPKIVVRISKSRVGQSSAPVKGGGPRHQKDKSLQIQSFDPPIVNLNPATLSRDEVVLKGIKSRAAVVKLPAPPRPEVRIPSSGPSAAPKSSMPLAPKVGFGRGNRADEANWRKPKEPKIGQPQPPPVKEVEVLSRSPHPITTNFNEPAIVHVPVAGSEKESVTSPITSPKSSKGRPSSGADVSFYRSPTMEKQHPVSFTVTSEIEPPATAASAGTTSEEKKPNETPSPKSASTLLTLPLAPATTAWEESPLGFPVSPLKAQAASDGLKAVWESAASAAGTSIENSLRGIVDELPPTIPTSVQEMKSDDGENKIEPGISVTAVASAIPDPPAPKRSLQDAHRAFQIVPESPASTAKPPPYPVPPPTTVPQRPTESSQAMLPPSPYMMPGQPPFPTSNGYGPRPPYGHPTPPTPNMMWGQPPQYVPNGSLSVRQQTPGGTGPSPPLPQQMWIGQPQSQQTPQAQLPPPFQGAPQYNYMQSPGMQQQQKPAQNMGPPMNHLGVGGPHLGPHNPSSMGYANPGMGQHLPPQGQGFPHRPPHMTSPNLYNASPVISSPGYNPAMSGPNRNMGRTGFELPPPASSQLYPQLQTRPFHPPGWSFAS
ncbi:hypothetical protein FRC04_002751 [Tulasnella sp. 424]|nr:hypothetical protein FRC04_002751 [Tulasnella sp. 424]KAG8962085.1 hypothetical protein FRC05_005525 [Tulasnella sp. 425]